VARIEKLFQDHRRGSLTLTRPSKSGDKRHRVPMAVSVETIPVDDAVAEVAAETGLKAWQIYRLIYLRQVPALVSDDYQRAFIERCDLNEFKADITSAGSELGSNALSRYGDARRPRSRR
jgi:hypothetical protein